MALVRFDPYRGFEGLARRMNKIMGEMEKGVSIEAGGFTPRVDIVEDDKNLYVHVEVPGMGKEDVKISLGEDNLMTIKGEKKSEYAEDDKDKSCIRSERCFGKFSRSFILPEDIDKDNISAKFDNGVVEIAVPRKEPEKPKEIDVEIS